jgi:hypothetical protein
VEGIIDSAARIDAKPNNEPFVSRAREELEECHEHIQELALGRIRPSLEEFSEMIMPMITKVRKNMRAVAIKNPSGKFEWWDTKAGREYWEFNLKAQERGVHIERIFVYEADESGELPQALRTLLHRQCEAGFDVYTVEVKQIRPDLRVDFAVIDEDFLWELLVTYDGAPLHYFCSTTDTEISRRIRQFKRLKEAAEQYVCEDTEPDTNAAAALPTTSVLQARVTSGPNAKAVKPKKSARRRRRPQSF